jgi:hypothetical protein
VPIARVGTPTQVGNLTGSISSGPINVPAGVVDNDGLILVLWLLGSGSLTVASGLPGWTLKRTTPISTICTCLLYTRVAASEPASYSLTYSASCRTIAQLGAYSGTDTVDFVEIEDAAIGGNTVHTTPSVSSADAADWAFCYFADRTSTPSSKTTVWAPGAGITEVAGSDISNNGAASAPWGTLDVCDSAGAIAVGAHSYSDTADQSTANAVAGIVIIKAAPSGTTQTADAALAVTANLSTAATDTIPAAAALTVTASLAAGATDTLPVDAALAVTANLATAATDTIPAAAPLAVTTGLSAGAVDTIPIGAALPVVALLNASSADIVTASLAVVATLTAAPARTALAGTTLAVAAALVAGDVDTRPAAAALAVTAALAAGSVSAISPGAVLAIIAALATTATAAAAHTSGRLSSTTAAAGMTATTAAAGMTAATTTAGRLSGTTR